MRTCFPGALALALIAGTCPTNAQVVSEQPTAPAIMLAQLQTVVTPPTGMFVPQPLGTVVEPPADAGVPAPTAAPAPVAARPVKTAARQTVRRATVHKRVVARGAARSPRHEQPRVTKVRHQQRTRAVADRRRANAPAQRTAVNGRAGHQRVVAAARPRRAARTARRIVAAPVLAEDELEMGFAGQPVVPAPMATDYAVVPQSLPYYAAPGPPVQVPGVGPCTRFT
jgi:hypothetical protein